MIIFDNYIEETCLINYYADFKFPRLLSQNYNIIFHKLVSFVVCEPAWHSECWCQLAGVEVWQTSARPGAGGQRPLSYANAVLVSGCWKCNCRLLSTTCVGHGHLHLPEGSTSMLIHLDWPLVTCSLLPSCMPPGANDYLTLLCRACLGFTLCGVLWVRCWQPVPTSSALIYNTSCSQQIWLVVTLGVSDTDLLPFLWTFSVEPKTYFLITFKDTVQMRKFCS